MGPTKAPCPIDSVILSERSESKDLRLVFLAHGWETTNPTAFVHREQPGLPRQVTPGMNSCQLANLPSRESLP
ncbi:MAG: hypothetical protein ABSC48_08070 [Terracidiphilus sp.]